MFLVVKVIVSGLIIGLINLVAQRNPAFAGWAAAFPLITFLSITWLWLDGQPQDNLAALVTGVLWGLIPTALLLVILAVALRQGVPLLVAFAISLAAWGVVTFVAQRTGLFG